MKQVPYSEMRNNTATKLTLITKRSISNPKEKFTALAHLLNVDYLVICYKELKTGKAAGIDGKTLESYDDQTIKEQIEKTVEKMKAKRYRPKPVKRVYIQKQNNKQRPLGIPSVIDKIIQLGMKKIAQAIFEPHFLNLSYGFRPNRNPHQALKAAYKMIMTKPINWIIDIDIKQFFDNVDHRWLMKCIKQKINDPVFNRLIVRFLKAGVMEQGKYYQTDKGTPQGSILSPLLANIYLHYILDLWFTKEETKQINGYTEMIRYADDFIIGAQTKPEAEQVLKHIKTRLQKFGLKVSDEKTRIIEFGRYAAQNSKNRGKRKPDTFNFLGFTHYCSKSRQGNFLLKVKTEHKRQKQKLQQMNQWLKSVRNLIKAKQIWQVLASKLRGHYNYYGISSNSRSINNYYYGAIQLLFKWINRRSQKQSFNWKEFSQYLNKYPLPKPALVYSMYDVW